MRTTEEVKRIEVTYLRKEGLLCGISWRTLAWSCRGEPSGKVDAEISVAFDETYMKLNYKFRAWNSEEWQPMNYKVQMVSTPCRYGGKRWWFICPNTRCGRRNSILYQY